VLDFGSSPAGLAGALLIAHPNLGDPNFRKTVLLLCEHDSEAGSFGLILNRPAENKTVAELVGSREGTGGESMEQLGPLSRVPVYFGGPVSPDQLTFAAFSWHAPSGRMECRHHLNLDAARESLRGENTVVRAYIGYSGWGKGQLEAELAQNAWMLAPPEPQVLEPGASGQMWRQSLSAFGPWFRLVGDAPDDLSRN